MLTKLATAAPPMFMMLARAALGICMSPAWPVTCIEPSTCIETPVAPTGWPFDLRPPDEFRMMPHFGHAPGQRKRLSRVALRSSCCSGSGAGATPRDDGQIGTSLRRTGTLHYVECRDRTAKTLQLQVSEILQPRYRF